MALTKVTTSGLTDNSVTSAKIEDGTIVDADVATGANIALSKVAGLSNVTQPTISGISPTTLTRASGGNITVSGTGFVQFPEVTFVNNSTGAILAASSVTYTSASSIVAAVPSGGANGVYKCRVVNPGGLGALSTATLTYSDAPTFQTAAGSLGSFAGGGSVSVDIDATGDDSSAVTFSVVSGSLPGGLSLNTSTGAITGTESGATQDTTYSFTIRATDSESQTADRAFSIAITVSIGEGGGFN